MPGQVELRKSYISCVIAKLGNCRVMMIQILVSQNMSFADNVSKLSKSSSDLFTSCGDLCKLSVN